MKYASQLLEIMAAYPGRPFRMMELVNYIAGNHAEHREKQQVRKGVWRVLQLLEASGHIDIEAQEGRGAAARYVWKASDRGLGKVGHANLESAPGTATIEPEKLRPQQAQDETA